MLLAMVLHIIVQLCFGCWPGLSPILLDEDLWLADRQKDKGLVQFTGSTGPSNRKIED